MMPASFSCRCTSRAVNLETAAGSKFLKAFLKFSRFLRMVIQLRPD